MAEDNEKLRCVPDSVDLFCETSSGTTIRVRTSDRKSGITITGLGYDTSRVLVTPNAGTTNDQGFTEFRVRCQGGAFCGNETTITFSADNGNYEECEVDVDCEKLPAGQTTAFGPDMASSRAFFGVAIEPSKHSAGDIHGIFVKEILRLRQESTGDYAIMIRQALRELVAAGCVSPAENEMLSGLADAASVDDKVEAAAVCRKVHQGLIRLNASATALAISGIACESAAASMILAIPVAEDILGAAIGAGVGLIFGNPFVGAIVGGALLSSAGIAR